MFGFGKKKPAPARKSTAARKPAPARKAAPARRSVAQCVVCGERPQISPTTRICGRKRCAADLRQRKNTPPTRKPAPRKPAPRRAAPTRKPTARQAAPVRATSGGAARELAAGLAAGRAAASASELADWTHHHRAHRDEILYNTGQLGKVVDRLDPADRRTLNTIVAAARGFTDARIRQAAEADLSAGRNSSTAARLFNLGQDLGALTVKAERAGIIRITR